MILCVIRGAADHLDPLYRCASDGDDAKGKCVLLESERVTGRDDLNHVRQRTLASPAEAERAMNGAYEQIFVDKRHTLPLVIPAHAVQVDMSDLFIAKSDDEKQRLTAQDAACRRLLAAHAKEAAFRAAVRAAGYECTAYTSHRGVRSAELRDARGLITRTTYATSKRARRMQEALDQVMHRGLQHMDAKLNFRVESLGYSVRRADFHALCAHDVVQFVAKSGRLQVRSEAICL